MLSNCAIVAVVGALAARGAAIALPQPLPHAPYLETLHESSFLDQFEGYDEALPNWRSTWRASRVIDPDTGRPKYMGQWGFETPEFQIVEGDRGLVARHEARLHGISTILPRVFGTLDAPNGLVFQYEVKLQAGLECGGAYVKLLRADDSSAEPKVLSIESAEEFSNETPYVVMFGPDKCGENNRIHLILKDALDNEHHLKNPPMAKTDRILSTLYTLNVAPNGDFEIRINGDVVRAGSVYSTADFDYVETSEPEFIADPTDTKPEDWEDEPTILDPTVSKPADWDESEPYLVPDIHATIPADWDVDEPEQIPDPAHPKPADWDEDEDGTWAPPLIDNPACLHHGCGEWIRPMVKNPKYVGKWVHPTIANPKYKGEWAPKMVANPAYVPPAQFELANVAGIGFDLWTMNKGIMFDNIYLGHYLSEAEAIGNATFVDKFEAEHVVYELMATEAREKFEREMAKAQKQAKIDDFNVERLSKLPYTGILGELRDIVALGVWDFIVDLQMFVSDLVDGPLETLLQRPGDAVWFSTVVLGTLGTMMALWSVIVTALGNFFSSAPAPAPKKSKKMSTGKTPKVKNTTTSGASGASGNGSATKAKKRV